MEVEWLYIKLDGIRLNYTELYGAAVETDGVEENVDRVW